jgi:serine/threonine protein kinase
LSKPDEAQLNPAAPGLAPDTIVQDRYRIVRQLGKGGMGAVYEAEDLRLGVTVALKETLSSEAPARKQFAQEAHLLAGLQHPALPRVSDHFTEGDRAFLVMQFISGVDLAKIIVQQPGPFPRDQVVAWADQLLDALMYLHSQDRQVIHRDIKPHNLKVTANGRIALLDFGLAKEQTSDAANPTLVSFFGYTRQYAPPEQIQGLSTGPQSDIYALGATLYYLLTGTRPVDAVTREAALMRGQPDPLRRADEIHPQVGNELAAILHRAMAPNAEDRYSSAKEFREVLRQVGRTSRRSSGNLEIAVDPKVLFDLKNEITILKSDLEVSLSVSGSRHAPAG